MLTISYVIVLLSKKEKYLISEYETIEYRWCTSSAADDIPLPSYSLSWSCSELKRERIYKPKYLSKKEMLNNIINWIIMTVIALIILILI